MNEINICLTGPRPNKLFGYNIYSPKYSSIRERLAFVLSETLLNNSRVTAHSGMALGADTIWAEIILKRKKNSDSLFFHADVPHSKQSEKWPNPNDRALYAELLSKADSSTLYSKEYTSYCLEQRNRGMVDSSDRLVAVWDGTIAPRSGTSNAIKYYTRTKDLPYYVIRPNDPIVRLDLVNRSLLSKNGHRSYMYLVDTVKNLREDLSTEGYSLKYNKSNQMIATKGDEVRLLDVTKEVLHQNYEIFTIKQYKKEGRVFVNTKNETFIKKGE